MADQDGRLWVGVVESHAGAVHLAPDRGFQAFRVEHVLGLEDAGGEGVGRIIRHDGHGGLADDRALVDAGGDVMHRAARQPTASDDGALVSVKAGKARQQGWVYVDHPLVPARHQPGRHDSHEARQGDELDIVRFEFGLDRLFKGLAVAAKGLVVDGGGGHAPLGGGLKPLGGGAVGEDEDWLGGEVGRLAGP